MVKCSRCGKEIKEENVKYIYGKPYGPVCYRIVLKEIISKKEKEDLD